MSFASGIKQLAGLIVSIISFGRGGIIVDNPERAPLWSAIVICILGLGVSVLLIIFLYIKFVS